MSDCRVVSCFPGCISCLYLLIKMQNLVSQGSQNYTVARDTFLAHLGATLWGSMRHIISPSLADGAFHFYDKISFQLFFITQEVRKDVRKLKFFTSFSIVHHFFTSLCRELGTSSSCLLI